MKYRTCLTLLLSAVSLFLCIEIGLAEGDPSRGQGLYGVCAVCHGQNAEGMREMNGPALAGREEWYLIRQLQNFKSGIRGTSAEDIYGLQMAPMSQLLADQQAIEDMAAYLNSLAE